MANKRMANKLKTKDMKYMSLEEDHNFNRIDPFVVAVGDHIHIRLCREFLFSSIKVYRYPSNGYPSNDYFNKDYKYRIAIYRSGGVSMDLEFVIDFGPSCAEVGISPYCKWDSIKFDYNDPGFVEQVMRVASEIVNRPPQ